MDQPRPGIVKLESQSEVAIAGERGYIATGWVRRVEDGGVTVIAARVLSYQPKVVPVQVNWV